MLAKLNYTYSQVQYIDEKHDGRCVTFIFVGGLNMNATKYARIAEVTGRDGAISVTLAAHQSIGLKVCVLWKPQLSLDAESVQV